MMLKFYERVGHENRRPSPFSWRIRYALAHKQLDAEVIPVRLADVERIVSISGQRFVPVLDHDGTVVADSWDIACYLERAFPRHPSLFGGPQGQAGAHFISRWSDETLHPLVRNLLLPDFLYCLDEGDRPYYRESRETLLGHPLEDCVEAYEGLARNLDIAPEPLRKTLEGQRFIAGESPGYADYVVFGAFQWARLGSPRPVLAGRDDALSYWSHRVMALFDGLADRFPGYPTRLE